jgi:hypothetical protein
VRTAFCPGKFGATEKRSGSRSSWSAWLLAGLALCTTACNSLRRVRDCKRVIDTVNVGLSDIAIQDSDAGASPVTYVRLAETYDALGKRLEGADSQDPALSKTFGAYRELIQRAAKQSRAFSEELDKPASTPEEKQEQESRLAHLRLQAKNDVNREASLVRKLNGLCHPQ